MPPPLVQIPDDAFDTTVPDPQYGKDFNDTVGDAGTDTDGFNDLINPIVDYGNTSPDVLAALDTHLTELDGVTPGLSETIEQEAVDNYNAAITNGQAGVDDFQNAPTPARGRVFPGAIMAWLTAQRGQEFGPEANVDQTPWELGIFAQIGFRVSAVIGQEPYPTKWFVRNKTHEPPQKFVKVELVSDNPIFEGVWWDDFNAVEKGADWHVYVNINPCKEGAFCGTVRLFQDDTHYLAMTLQVFVAHDNASAFHRPKYACAADPGNPLPPPGGPPTGGGGGGTGGGPGGGGPRRPSPQ